MKLTFQAIRAKPARHRPALVIAHHAERPRAVGECPAGSIGRQRKDYNGAGHRLVILILYLDYGLARGALPDIVRRALAFQDDQIERRRNLGRRWNP